MEHASAESMLDPSLDGFRVEISKSTQRADIILDQPSLNVISMRQRDQMRSTFEALDRNDDVRLIVLRGARNHFSSGGNINGFLEASPDHVSRLADHMSAPARCSKPFIAANRGYCFGVGFEISLACDFRIAAESCLYALPEQKLGQIPGSGRSVPIPFIKSSTRSLGGRSFLRIRLAP